MHKRIGAVLAIASGLACARGAYPTRPVRCAPVVRDKLITVH